MNSKRLVNFTKLLLDICYHVGILICVLVPIIIKNLGEYFEDYNKYYFMMCILFIAAGILGLWILRQLRYMLTTVKNEDCFIYDNVTCLKKMGIASFIISIIFIIVLIFYMSFATAVIILVFFIAGLFSLVLSRVFKEAVNYKRENDLTI